MNKDMALKKQLIKEAIMATIILLFLLGCGGLLYNYGDDLEADKRLKDNENGSLRSQQVALSMQLETSLQNSGNYKFYIEHHNQDFILDRKVLTDELDKLREKNHLVKMDATISPITDMGGSVFNLKSGTVIKSDVTITCESITDTSFYAFVESLQTELPGIVVVTHLEVTRTAELSRAILAGLSQHQISPMVTEKLTFIWIGLRPKADMDTTGKPPVPPMPGGLSNAR